MSTSIDSRRRVTAVRVDVTDDTLVVELSDGRALSVPLAWYPRLEHATRDERTAWTLIGDGGGIHWEAIDEDVSLESLIAGRASNESQASLKRWLATRPARSHIAPDWSCSRESV